MTPEIKAAESRGGERLRDEKSHKEREQRRDHERSRNELTHAGDEVARTQKASPRMSTKPNVGVLHRENITAHTTSKQRERETLAREFVSGEGSKINIQYSRRERDRGFLHLVVSLESTCSERATGQGCPWITGRHPAYFRGHTQIAFSRIPASVACV
jgi:hypothetical protein